MEDALELVVGEIEDEFDQERDPGIVALEEGWQVPGHLSLRRLERILHRSLNKPEGIDSVGGLASMLLGDGIAAGARASWDGVVFRVDELGEGRPTRLLVQPHPRESEP